MEFSKHHDYKISAFILGVFFLIGISIASFLISKTIITYKEYERSVTVKGLSEREFEADTVIWSIQFIQASNDLLDLYKQIDINTQKVVQFLQDNNIQKQDISLSPILVNDKIANSYGNNDIQFRYSAIQSVTIHSHNVQTVRNAMDEISNLGKQGIVFTTTYNKETQYIFSKLNEVKPIMIEEATRNAREVAQKFASDSKSKLGKIKKASQGQFSITSRDDSNKHIKKVRVVSTIEYYLSD